MFFLVMFLACWFQGVSVAQNQDFDQVIEVGVRPGQMVYDIDEFTVPAGGNIKLIFDNSNGQLQHNLLILTPGDKEFALQIARDARSMENPIQNNYVPDSKEILFHTSLLDPGEKETITFQAPSEPGDHPFVCTMPGHSSSMNGVMHVVTGENQDSEGDASGTSTRNNAENDADRSGADRIADGEKTNVFLSDLSYKYYEGFWTSLPDFDKLEVKKSGTLSDNKLTLAPRNKDTRFGMVFEGKIYVPQTGMYRIFHRSSNGARLFIDGDLVLNYDQLQQASLALKRAKLKKGLHDYRLEYFQWQYDSVLAQAIVGPGNTRYLLSETDFDTTVDYLVKPVKKPHVVRAILPDVPPRSLAVGLPGGPHYVFDTVNGVVRYAWTDGFLNVGGLVGEKELKSGQGRGGWMVNVVGRRFDVGLKGVQPVRFGDPEQVPEVEFNGYEIDGDVPVLIFSLNGVPVRHMVTGNEKKQAVRLTYKFLKRPEKPIYFRINRSKVNVTSRYGEWVDDRTLKIGKKKKFTIIINND